MRLATTDGMLILRHLFSPATPRSPAAQLASGFEMPPKCKRILAPPCDLEDASVDGLGQTVHAFSVQRRWSKKARNRALLLTTADAEERIKP